MRRRLARSWAGRGTPPGFSRGPLLPGLGAASIAALTAVVGPARADLPVGPWDGHALASVHGEALAEHRDVPATPVMASEQVSRSGAVATAGPSDVVYGYWPYWGDDLATVPFDDLSHLALFSTGIASDGTITNTTYWTSYAARALSLAAPYGVRIHMTVISTDANVMGAVLGSAAARSNAVSQILQLVNGYGGHGVNIDFEGVPASQKANFVTFIQSLKATGMEVWLAMPAVDWSGAYDYDALGTSADGLFIMAYGYHYSGGNPGPIAPLYGESPWSNYAIDWTIADYLYYGAPANKVVLGLPLYGYDWPSSSTAVPGTATGKGVSMFYAQAVSAAEQYGRKWDAITHTPYAFPDSVSQLWYDDVQSLSDKMAYALDQGLLGVGLWALTYEDSDPTLWSEIRSLTNAGCADGDGDGFGICEGDCDDSSATVHPGAQEVCDGLDDNCDGLLDNTPDADGDGYNLCADCNDEDPGIHPGVTEIPNDGVDNNCDGQVDEAGEGCGAAGLTAHAPLRFGGLGIALLGLLGLRLRRRT